MRGYRAWTFLSTLAVLLGSGACSLIVDSQKEQCAADGDCASRGFANAQCIEKVCVRPVSVVDAGTTADVDAAPVDPKWGCLGNITWGKQDTSQKVTRRERFVRLLGEAPVTGLQIRACGRLDPTCQVVLGQAVTDDQGYAVITLPKFFEGFYDLQPPPSYPNMVPSLMTLLPPPEKDSDLTAEIPSAVAPHLTSTSELNYLLNEIGSAIDPELGNLLGIVLDCQGQPTAGVSVRVSIRDKKTISYYTDTTGTPSVTTQETAPRGEAGWVNIPTGVISVEATVNALNRRMGTYTAMVRKGHVTYLPMSPSP